MQQRVVARAFAPDPILMDEPLAHSGRPGHAAASKHSLEQWGKREKQFVFVTHSIEESCAAALGDQVASIDVGATGQLIHYPHCPSRMGRVALAQGRTLGPLTARQSGGVLREEVDPSRREEMIV